MQWSANKIGQWREVQNQKSNIVTNRPISHQGRLSRRTAPAKGTFKINARMPLSL